MSDIEKELATLIPQAMRNYLRRSRVGGMPTETSDLIDFCVSDAAAFGYFSVENLMVVSDNNARTLAAWAAERDRLHALLVQAEKGLTYYNEPVRLEALEAIHQAGIGGK